MNIETIYTAQSHINETIVREKQANKDYEITVEMIDDDGEMVAMLVDGNHSWEAAKRDGVEPEIKIVEGSHKMTLVQYVEAFNDLSNPVNIVTGADLW
jgi:hypothetical protein